MVQLKLIILVYCFLTTVFCVPVDKVNTEKTLDTNESVGSVDQLLNLQTNKTKLTEETTTSGVLFNNNEPEEEKIFKINEAEDLIDIGNLSFQSRQQPSAVSSNIQSLLDQTETISRNLETMIKELSGNKRHASAAMLKLLQQNVKRLNSSLLRLNNRVNSLGTGTSQGSATSSSSSSSPSSSSAISNATYNVAAQINSVATNLRNQVNAISSDVNQLLKNVRLQKPAGNTSKPNKPTTPSG